MSSVSTKLQKETQVEVWKNTSQQESVFTAFLNSPKILQRTCFLFLKKRHLVYFDHQNVYRPSCVTITWTPCGSCEFLLSYTNTICNESVHMFSLGHFLNVKWRCFRKREFIREVPFYNWALVVQRMYNYNTNE